MGLFKSLLLNEVGGSLEKIWGQFTRWEKNALKGLLI
jgi:hypothetical protein